MSGHSKWSSIKRQKGVNDAKRVCPDCGGAGYLPGGEVLVDWRSRDIERAHSAPTDNAHADVAWLATELRRARAALLTVYSLANEGDDSDIKQAIRFEANRALGIHPITEQK